MRETREQPGGKSRRVPQRLGPGNQVDSEPGTCRVAEERRDGRECRACCGNRSHGSAFRLQPLVHRSPHWPCLSSGRTACGHGLGLRERSAPFNRGSGSRRTASPSKAASNASVSGRSRGTTPTFPCIPWRPPAMSKRPFPALRGTSGTTLAWTPVGGVGSRWSSCKRDRWPFHPAPSLDTGRGTQHTVAVLGGYHTVHLEP